MMTDVMRSPFLRSFLALLAVFSLVATACSSDDETGQPVATATPAAEPTPSSTDSIEFVGSGVERDDSSGVPADDVARVATGDAQLGLDLLALASREGDNVFLSPYSVATALALLLPGARGDTELEIAAVLSAGDGSAYHPARGALDARVLAPGRIVDGEAEPFTLRAANQLFGQDGFPFRQAYLDLLARSYGAQLGALDFASDPEASRQLINQWVEDQTEERIVDLVPEGVISTLTRLVMVNAVYFKANWREPFDPENTIQAPFHDLDGDVGAVDMMQGTVGAGYGAGDGYEVVRLGYAGGTTSMLVIVPDAGTMSDFVTGLDAAGLDDIRESISSHQVELSLPIFEFRTELALKPMLQELGMRRAFMAPGPDGADLTGIVEDPVLFVQDALHQAFVSVDEQGTEAAAATAIVVGLTAQPDIATLTVDRPFIFVIEHDETAEMLFLGQVTDLAGTASDDGSPASTSSTEEPVELESADVEAIGEAFDTFFDGLGGTVDDKVALLESGETYRLMLDAASANDQFQQMTTEIRDIRAGSPSECETLGAQAPCAVVTHDLMVGGLPMAVAIESPAVLVDGTWLVGSQAWCNVVEIGGASCP